MTKIKTARHHWWPRCISKHWTGDDGRVGWIKPDGSVVRLPPAQLGMIGNGHTIKLDSSGQSTHWDTTFEPEFDKADSAFPSLIRWAEDLGRAHRPEMPLRERFIAQTVEDCTLADLTECVVSLAVRSPRNREQSVALAERFRGPLEGIEREALIGANMRGSQRIIADTIGARGKFAILFSEGREFIFGDGFFHNVTVVRNSPMAPMILAPITPSMCAIVSRPLQFGVEPRLSTMVLNDREVDQCNHAVQVYARQALYFRSQQPVLDPAFASGQHLMYAEPDNPMAKLIASMPGVEDRNFELDRLFGVYPNRLRRT